MRIKTLLLLVFCSTGFPAFSQSDTIPEIIILFDRKEAKTGTFLYRKSMPENISVLAMASASYRRRAPTECQFRISEMEYLLTDSKGSIKHRQKIQYQGNLSNLLSKIRTYDVMTIKVLTVHRKKATGVDVFYPLNRQFSFTIR